MKRLVAVIAIGLFAAACASHQDLQRPAAQDDFGVQMAKMNLWREAMFRFKRAVQIDPGDARAHNNLAVALEATGDFENARKEYLEALKLDRSNAYIQKNYSRFVEFLSRNRKREAKDVKNAGPVMPKQGAPVAIDASPPLYPPQPGSNEPPRPVPGGPPPSDRPPPKPTPPPTPPPGGSR